eukprot:10735036-Alexandrium_andersonii.AAC.1
MSASLVGSEMCIRDRTAQVPGILLGYPVLDPSPPGGPAAILGHAVTAVSYTHLTLPTICSV